MKKYAIDKGAEVLSCIFLTSVLIGLVLRRAKAMIQGVIWADEDHRSQARGQSERK